MKKSMYRILNKLFESNQPLIEGLSEDTAEDVIGYLNLDSVKQVGTKDYLLGLVRVYLGVSEKYKTKGEFFRDNGVLDKDQHDDDVAVLGLIKNGIESYLFDIDEKKKELETAFKFFEGKNF